MAEVAKLHENAGRPRSKASLFLSLCKCLWGGSTSSPRILQVDLQNLHT